MKTRFLPALIPPLFALAVQAEEPSPAALNDPAFWKTYHATPASWPADEIDAAVRQRAEGAGVRAFFYAGAAYQGKPTRVFAFYGAPPPEKRGPDGKVPGIILVHGGGGTAFESWVKLWVDRGYAALAMDTCGALPLGKKPEGRFSNDWHRLPDGGPMGWGGFEQLLKGEPALDNWMHQATAAVVLGHSWLLAQPEVDPQRTGITGISWGAVLTCRAAGADPRFQFAVPVYGCGFLHESSAWERQLSRLKNDPDATLLWSHRYDPSGLLVHAPMPFLWVNGTNDFAFPLDAWLKSARSTLAPPAYCMPLRMSHAHGGSGENPPEILAFANSITRGGIPLAKPLSVTVREGRARVTWEAQKPIAKVELLFTKDDVSPWKDRLWERIPAQWTPGDSHAQATLPDGTAHWFFHLTDKRGLAVSAFP